MRDERQENGNQENPQGQSSRTGHSKRIWLLLIGQLMFICLIITAIFIAGVPGRQQAERVETAIRATMPNYCSEPGEKLKASPRLRQPWPLPPSPAEIWRVDCFTPKSCQPIVTVYVSKCEAKVVTAFNGNYTQRLATCP